MNRFAPALAFLALFAFGFTGCTGESQPAAPTDVSGDPPALPPGAEAGHDHEHDHPSEGPHHGSLIELGNHEYHGEVVHDDAAKTVTIYILDASAAKTFPIEATEIVINATPGGSPKQFTLKAEHAEGEPEGQASKFVSSDAELGAALDSEDAKPRLVVKIAGKSFNAAVTHSHDHEGHAH